MLVTTLVSKLIFFLPSPWFIFNKYLHSFMTLNNVTMCPSMGYIVALHGVHCYFTTLQQGKCTINLVIFK
jgi:hypothetical protein